MSNEIENLVGLTIKDKENNILLIQPTKKPYSKHKLYLHNLTDNIFVSTIFIHHINEERVMFDYNYFDLDNGLQVFNRVRMNFNNYKYTIRKEKDKYLDSMFMEMEKQRREDKKNVVRKYKEI